MENIWKVIEDKKCLLLDGAIGTELYNRGLFINRCFDEATLSNPQLITQLHEDYKRAGAEVLTTNSWGANSFKLKNHTLKDKVFEINKKAAELARQVAGNTCYVAGSMGPLGVRIEPWGPTSFEEARQAFSEQLDGLVAGGIDLICLETFSDISEIHQAILACKEVAPDIPVFAHIIINMDGRLPSGTEVEWAIHELDQWGADVVGLNCSVGPGPMLSAVEKIRAVTAKPISLQPNAGLPRQIEGRTIYMCTPEYMAEFTKNFLQAGVQFIGGCCGTSPEHIRAMANAMKHYRAMQQNEHLRLNTKTNTASQQRPSIKAQEPPAVSRVAFEEKSQWSAKIARGEKVYTCELLPPPGIMTETICAKAQAIKDAGLDAVNIPDGPRASARMSAILTAVLLEREVGIETILHYTCRDRNLLGMQSDILGAHAIGLRNLLLVTGDPPKIGSYPNATGVFDIDAIGLTNMVYQLNGGLDLGGRNIGQPTAISIGVGANPVHQNLDYEFKRFRYKVEAGAEWAITQPVFDLEALYRFLDFIDKNNIAIPIIAGIWPLVSYRNALFMNNEVPGVVIPNTIMEKMAAAQDGEEAKKIGVEIAFEMVEKILPDVAGIQISAPFGRVDLALKALGKTS